MSASTWIRRCFTRHSPRRVPLLRQRKTNPKPSIRPALEALEDRFAPAVLTVNTLADGTSDTTHLDLREALTLVNNTGNPGSLNQTSMPSGWASQISGAFGSNDTIQFAPNLLTQNAGFGYGVIGLTSVGDGTAGPSALGVSKNVSIIGPSESPGITIERPATAPGINVLNMRLFYVGTSGDLTLKNLTLQGGIAVGGNGAALGGGGLGAGGAVFNQGTLNIQNSLLTGNTARGGGGGMGGDGTIGSGSDDGGPGLIGQGGGPNGGNPFGPGNGGFGGGGAPNYHAGNGGFGGGGGGGASRGFQSYGGDGGFGGGGGGETAFKPGMPTTLLGMAGVSEFGGGEGATIQVATAGIAAGGGGAGFGGAIFKDQGSVTLTNTTLTGNLAAAGPSPIHAGMGAGGALFNYQGHVIITDSTIAGNTAQRGGGIFDDTPLRALSPYLSLTNSIVANSNGGGADYDRSLSSGTESVGSHDLIGSNAGFEGGVVSSANPKLSTLGNHGGPTQTLALLPGSPAIVAGLDSVLSFIAQAEGVAPTNATDQTGNPRILGSHIDIGAVAYNPAAPTGVDIHGQPSNGIMGQPIGGPITVAVVDANGNTIPDSNQAVTLAISSGPAGAVLAGTTTVDAVNGVATFTNLTLNEPGTYTLTASGGVLTPDFSNPFTISVVNASPPSPPAAPALQVPSLLGWFDQLLDGIETVNGDGTVTATDSILGLPLLVSTFDSSGQLQSVSFLGMNVTFLFLM